MSKQGVEVFEVVVGSERLVVASAPVAHARSPLEVLTAAERQVALLVTRGLSNAAIARQRRCAVRTVANQLQAIYRKLGIGSRAELAALVLP
ncbi:MAG: helix-turn-helix transcriptional regulator [Myxococcales bacterium]|nr:helix-turn-helix transcriptional regulator [Myxococcales bacterium]